MTHTICVHIDRVMINQLIVISHICCNSLSVLVHVSMFDVLGI